MASPKSIKSIALIFGDDQFCTNMAYHPSHPWIAVVLSNPVGVSIYHCDSGALLYSLQINDEIDAISFDPTGYYLIAVSTDYVHSWHVLERQLQHNSAPNNAEYDLDQWFPSFAFSSDGIWMLFSNDWQLRSPDGLRSLSSIAAPRGERLLRVVGGCDPIAVTYDEDGSNHPSPTITIWNLKHGRMTSEISLEKWENVLVSHDASKVLIGAGDAGGEYRLYDPQSGGIARNFAPQLSGSHCDFVSDNLHVAALLQDSQSQHWTSVLVINPLTGKENYLSTRFPIRPFVKVSPFFPIIAAIANDSRCSTNITQFWKPIDGSQIATAVDHVGLSGLALYSPNGYWFATATNRASSHTIMNAGSKGQVVVSDIRSII